MRRLTGIPLVYLRNQNGDSSLDALGADGVHMIMFRRMVCPVELPFSGRVHLRWCSSLPLLHPLLRQMPQVLEMTIRCHWTFDEVTLCY